MRKKYISYLTLEILTTVFVILLFRFIENRNIAAVIAGSTFIAIGAYIVWDLCKTRLHFKSFSFYAATIHLFLTAIPLLASRLMNWSVPHSELLILGMPAPSFHKLAEKVFTVLILCTLIDLCKTFIPVRKERAPLED